MEEALIREEEEMESEYISESERSYHEGLEEYHNQLSFFNVCHGCTKGGILKEYPDCGHYTPACKKKSEKNWDEYVLHWEGENG